VWHGSFPSPLATILLEFPVSVVQWANLSSFEPAGDAVEMEGMLEGQCQLYNERIVKRLPTLQIPHATVHSSLVADAWFA
jgi:hypothetical protein